MRLSLSVLAGLALVSTNGCVNSQPGLRDAPQPIRIDAGAPEATTDSLGRVWEADAGFTGGGTVDRGGIVIANTPTPELYRTERYAMSGFTRQVPNGRYAVELHFCETYHPNLAAARGKRLFDIDVEGQKLTGFEPVAVAGDVRVAVTRRFSVAVADGSLDIAFRATPIDTADYDPPCINAIEIVRVAAP